MSERARRQSRRQTRVELHRSLSGAGRAWVMEVWQAAQVRAANPLLLGPLTTAVGTNFVESHAAGQRLGGKEAKDALFTVIKTGYASRAVLVGPTIQPSLDASSFRIAAPFDGDQLANDSAAVGELREVVRSIASTGFDSVMTLPREVWTSYVAIATLRLQRQLASSTVTWRELHRETIEGLLRYGYVLRCLDEALDGSPKPRADAG